MAKELSAEQAAALIKQDNEVKPRSRRKKFDFTDRSNTNWFRLRHRFGTCSNEDCESPPDKGGRNRMISDVDGVEMCRICFTGGYKL